MNNKKSKMRLNMENIIDKKDKTLYLTLKKQWFDMINDGIKTEEYREIKPYWVKNCLLKI